MEYLELEGIGPTGLVGRLTAGIQGYVALGVLSSQPSLHASTSSRLFRAAAPLFQKPFSPDELVLALAALVRQSQEMRRLTRQMRADAAESRSLARHQRDGRPAACPGAWLLPPMTHPAPPVLPSVLFATLTAIPSQKDLPKHKRASMMETLSACGSQRRRSESNRRMEVLQTSALPLGYGAECCGPI